MGRRKSKRQAPQKAKSIVPLDTQFKCPFCNHQNSCEVTISKTKLTARIICRVCMECYQTRTNSLTEPIYEYNDWIDACEAVN